MSLSTIHELYASRTLIALAIEMESNVSLSRKKKEWLPFNVYAWSKCDKPSQEVQREREKKITMQCFAIHISCGCHSVDLWHVLYVCKSRSLDFSHSSVMTLTTTTQRQLRQQHGKLFRFETIVHGELFFYSSFSSCTANNFLFRVSPKP